MAKPGKVKPQNRNAHRGKPAGDAPCGGNVFGTGKAMGKKRGRKMWAVWQVKARGKLIAVVAGKGNSFGRHVGPFLVRHLAEWVAGKARARGASHASRDGVSTGAAFEVDLKSKAQGQAVAFMLERRGHRAGHLEAHAWAGVYADVGKEVHAGCICAF